MSGSQNKVVEAGCDRLPEAALCESDPSNSENISATDKLLMWADRRRRLLFGLLLVFQLAAFSGQWRIGPDTSVYVSLGRNLARGAGYRTTGWAWSKVHFGMPMLLAANFRLFGLDTFWPVLTLMWLMGVAALALVYRLFQFHMPRAQAVVATLLVGISFTFTEFLYEPLTDIPAFLGVVMSVTAFEALTDHPATDKANIFAGSPGKWLFWVLILIVGLMLAVIMRPASWALIVAISIAFAWRIRREQRHWWTFAAIGALIAGAMLYWLNHHGGHIGNGYAASLYRWLQNVVSGGQTSTTPRRLWKQSLNLVFGELTTQAYFTCGFGPLVSNLAAVGLLAATFWTCRKRLLWMLWLGGTLLMLLVYPEPQTRYYLPILPLMALAYWQIAAWIGRRPRRSLAAGGLAICVALWVLPNALRLGRLAYLQHARPFLLHVTNGRYVPLYQMACIVREKLPPDAVVLSQEALSLEAFARQRQFMTPIDSELPTDLFAQLNSLLDRGLLYAVDAEGPDMAEILARQGLIEGPALATVPRAAWKLPRAPGRWFSQQPLPVPNPLVLRQVVRRADGPSLDRRGSSH